MTPLRPTILFPGPWLPKPWTRREPAPSKTTQRRTLEDHSRVQRDDRLLSFYRVEEFPTRELASNLRRWRERAIGRELPPASVSWNARVFSGFHRESA